jgi:hypothetical protein
MQTRDWLSIILIIVTAVAAFLGLKDFVRDRVENLQRQVSELKIENERLKIIQDHLKDQFLDQLRDLKNLRKR